ncbi:Metallo-dependent phosphatase [Amniculicola lignicola CBS 123094]|uniref:Metallo-dependent phosphatase n=1 Tax=Amniculicola lignicola CBS 123094 TaxID=1392246 RepID=A0A6A5WU58_9PLEO|nr:Metallo-dependent phosphatase [Amniculicola lignicola CBS 123094]
MEVSPLDRSRSSRSPTPPAKRSRATASTQPVRFLIISDTHGFELASHPECDVVLHCGDMTEDGSPASISGALESLAKIKAELKLCIAGNHEISLDKEYYTSEGGSEKDSEKSGVTFLNEGTHEFTVESGASFTLYASPYTPKYGASAFQYESREDRYNPPTITPAWGKNVGNQVSTIPEGIDIVMTHGPPQYILDRTGDGRNAGCEHLRRAIVRTRPRLHCFGHVHSGYGAQRIQYGSTIKNTGERDTITTLPPEWVGRNQAKRKGYACLSPGAAEAFKRDKNQTLTVNAAIMDGNNEPKNMPWIVDLELACPSSSPYRVEEEE